MKRKITNSILLGVSLFLTQQSISQTYTFEKVATFSQNGTSRYTEINGTTVFVGSTNGTTWDIWKTDGTAAGTSVLFSVNAPNDYSLDFLPIINNKLIIIDVENSRIISSDGTTTGTTAFYNNPNVTFGYENAGVKINTNQILFVANSTNEGSEMYITDGTSAGTSLLKDINPGTGDSNPSLYSSFELNGDIFFPATDGVLGYELWKTDGTTAGTVLVKDVNIGSDNGYIPTVMGCSPTKLGNKVVFLGCDVFPNYEPWITDGTTVGTYKIKEIFPGNGNNPQLMGSMNSYNVFNNEIYFFATGSVSEGMELWKTDGTDAGTVLVKDINPTGNCHLSGAFLFIFAHDNQFYFVAEDGTSGRELWKSDGTTAGTVLVKDINSGSNQSWPKGFTLLNNTVFFGANDGVNGDELWKTDGTAAGTVMVKDIHTSGSGIDGGYLNSVQFDNRLFFSANVTDTQMQLFYSNGTEIGTQIVHPGGSQTNDDFTDIYTVFEKNGSLFFTASYDNGISKSELWKISSATSGIDMNSEIESFIAFPNPANTNVNLTNIPSNGTVRIMDITGKVIYTNQPINDVLIIEIANWVNGIYIIQVEQNGAIAQKKLVVNK